MNQPFLRVVTATTLATLLAACGGSAPSAEGGRPALPTGISVQHPAAPANAYLLLLDENEKTVYQQAVKEGETSTQISHTGWMNDLSAAQPLSSIVPEHTTYRNNTQATTKVLFYHWRLWHDSNTNGQREAGELLQSMSHDRMVYAEKPIALSYTTSQPKMQQHWNLRSGWNRAEHYVYLPNGHDTYQRIFETAAVPLFKLHIPTPITSQ